MPLWAFTVQTYPGALTGPPRREAGTSLGPWRQRGIGHSVYPYVIDNERAVIGMHGGDRRICTEALAKGTDFMYQASRFRS